MGCFLIGYDLKKGADYGPLHEEIKKLSTSFWNLLDSTWIIESEFSTAQLRDRLKGFNVHEKLLVLTARAPAAWEGFGPKGDEWLKSVLK